MLDGLVASTAPARLSGNIRAWPFEKPSRSLHHTHVYDELRRPRPLDIILPVAGGCLLLFVWVYSLCSILLDLVYLLITLSFSSYCRDIQEIPYGAPAVDAVGISVDHLLLACFVLAYKVH